MSTLLLHPAEGGPVALRRRTVVGSGPQVDLFVNDPGVAALHAELRREGAAWVVLARDGVLSVDDMPVQQATLAEGARLQLGGVELRVGFAPNRWRSRVLYAAALLVVALAALCAAGLAGARPQAAARGVELEAGGPSVSWEGEGDALLAIARLPDPRSSLVELHVESVQHHGPLSLVLNGAPVPFEDGGRVAPLREHAVAGENRLELRARGLRAVTLQITALPLPRCDGGVCAAPLQNALARAERLERESSVGAANLFHAWSLLRKARGLAVASGDSASRATAEARLRRVEKALDDRCAGLRFAAARSLALEDASGARRAAEALLAAFPSDEHPCRGSGEQLLRLLDEGGW